MNCFFSHASNICFLQRYSPPVLIDEVQYAPELFPFIKILVDNRKQNGDFWLTGSQMFRTMKNVSESLTGRAGIIPIQGLSNSEINGFHPEEFSTDPTVRHPLLQHSKAMGVSEIFERIFRGSMPRLYENSRVKTSTYFESYLDTYITRDIRDLAQVGDEAAFLKFVKVVAARTATNLNYDALAVETGISGPTAKTWLSLLVSSGLVTLIEPFYNNALKRVIKAPRMYFSDTGLCAHLMGWGSPQVLENSAMSGEFFETWVVMEIYKSFVNAGERPPLYFYRDSNRKEIDLIIYRDGTAYPIEIKKGTAPKDAIKNFSVLNPIQEAEIKTEIGPGAVVCLASDIIPIDKKNSYVPAWVI